MLLHPIKYIINAEKKKAALKTSQILESIDITFPIAYVLRKCET